MHSIFHKWTVMSQMHIPNLVTFRCASSTGVKFFYHHLYLHFFSARKPIVRSRKRNNSRTPKRIMKLPLRFGSLSHIYASMGYLFRIGYFISSVSPAPYSYHWSKSYNSIMHSNRNLINFILVTQTIGWMFFCAHMYKGHAYFCHLNFHGIHR